MALAVYQASKFVFVLVNLAAVVCEVFQAFYMWSISTTFGNFCFKHAMWKWEMCTEITCEHLEQVEGFWGCYCHLARPSTLPNPTDIHLFKEGIRPLWEVRDFQHLLTRDMDTIYNWLSSSQFVFAEFKWWKVRDTHLDVVHSRQCNGCWYRMLQIGVEENGLFDWRR